tara:strand:- start:499 stop:765 length:267 start_codon:yes stop_codon:yes gene_type:complete
MIIINGICFPKHSEAIILEPRECHSPAIIGYDQERDVAIYSERLFLMSLVLCQGYTYYEAIEWYSYNTLGTRVKNYPVFITDDGDEAL